MKIYLTLDYELYLGKKTGSVQNCLLQPSAALLSVLDKHNVKATFFVDAAYLLRMKQLKETNNCLQEDFLAVCNHVASIAAQGHSIQLHFHPQWLYSTHDGKKWDMDFAHYKLSDMEHSLCCQSIKEALYLLQSLSEKPVKSFRAGGYSLMDFESYADLFNQLGLSIDTSVLRGRRVQSPYQQYDYTKVPPLTKYRFSSSNVIREDEGLFEEYPISTCKTNGILATIMIIKGKSSSIDPSMTKKWGDGESVGGVNHRGRFASLLGLLKNATHPSIDVASIDSTGAALERVYQFSKSHYSGEEFVIIGHPKNITRLSLQRFESFVLNHKDDTFETL
jgi:hypothetical protein